MRASGWGPAFLDMGSGYDIGKPPEQLPCQTEGALLRFQCKDTCHGMRPHFVSRISDFVIGLNCQPIEQGTASWHEVMTDHDRLVCTGQRALAAVARAVDGRGERTDLVEATCRHCNVTKAEDLLE